MGVVAVVAAVLLVRAPPPLPIRRQVPAQLRLKRRQQQLVRIHYCRHQSIQQICQIPSALMIEQLDQLL